MNTYLLPISDSNECWIEHVTAKGISEAEDKFVKFFADDYDFVDYGDSFAEACNTLAAHEVIVGGIYDIEEF